MTGPLVLVVPVFNEAALIGESLPQILQAARAAVRSAGLDLPVRLLAVDDGSSDGTRASLARLKAQDDAIGFISFTRNFGKEAAIHAGLQQACGPLQARVMVVIDADLQHPPQLIGTMLEHWRGGAAVVEAVKQLRGDESALRRLAARAFLWHVHPAVGHGAGPGHRLQAAGPRRGAGGAAAGRARALLPRHRPMAGLPRCPRGF
jgi:glycosyltransferase involved in cell wall biosynthesis